MSHNKNLTRMNIKDILSPYGIIEIDSYQLLSGGSENSNYLVKTPWQAYVLTISEQKSFEKANVLASLLDYLHVNKFASSKIIKTIADQAITLWDKKPVMLKEYLDGDI